MKLGSGYRILTNRRRAVIALAHSVVFLLIAWHGMITARTVEPIWAKSAPSLSSMFMLSVYAVVSAVLAQLTLISRCVQEKLYFGFCASSAMLGLLRTAVGDPTLRVALYLRVVMLTCAVAMGSYILGECSKARRTPETHCEAAALESI